MEGAAYSLQVHPEPMMRLYLDKLIAIMAGAQWEDGYLYTFYSVPQKQPRCGGPTSRTMHEQYCMGHMLEAAVAHYQVTGDKAFLNVATRCADYLCQVFGPGKRTDPPGHQEIEIGLCKLYRVTGDGKYLDLAKFLLDQRGRTGNRGPKGDGKLYGAYAQDHIPVIEQTEATGHSVRAMYMYTGMADVAALTGNMDYIKAIDTIWNDVVGTKLYVTGGIGAAGRLGGLRRASMSCPTRPPTARPVPPFANIFWNHRMFLMSRRREVPRRPGADALQRRLVGHLDEGRPVLLSERPGVRPGQRAQPVVRLCLLPLERRPLHPLGAGVCLCLQGRGPLREPVPGRPTPRSRPRATESR